MSHQKRKGEPGEPKTDRTLTGEQLAVAEVIGNFLAGLLRNQQIESAEPPKVRRDSREGDGT